MVMMMIDDDVVDDATSFPDSLLPLETPFLFVCVHVPCSKMPESGSKSERNLAFSVFRSSPSTGYQAITRPGYQASKASIRTLTKIVKQVRRTL